MNIEDLPPKYQKQAEEKLHGTRHKTAPKKPKYNNVKESYGNLKFDSKKERQRFIELMAMQEAGLISELRLQHNFTLREGYTMPNGERVKGTIYKADFTYKDSEGDFIIEDVKGVRTDVYKLKRKMMLDKGFIIREV